MSKKSVTCTAQCFDASSHYLLTDSRNSIMSPICVIGKCPGKYELIHSHLFVGPSGRKLSEGLISAGLLRSDCWLTNLVKCNPAEKRLTRDVFLTCTKTHLLNELKQLKRLKLIVALGLQPVQYFVPSLPLSVNAMDSLHGSIHPIEWEGLSLDMFVTYPPSQALVNPVVNEFFMADMKLLKEYLKHEHFSQMGI